MAHLFCRVSSNNQYNGLSISLQEETLNNYSNNRGWSIKSSQKVIGSVFNGDPYNLENSKYKNSKLLFYSVDRFSRNLNRSIKIIKYLIDGKNSLHFVKEKLEVNKENDVNYNLLLNYIKKSEEESLKISERVKNIKKFINSKGLYMGGKVPFGKRLTENKNGRKILELHDKESNVIDFIIKCKTIGTTAKQLNNTIAKCYTKDNKKSKIVLGLDGYSNKFLETSLSNSCIANILNDFSICNKKWTMNNVGYLYNKYNINKKKRKKKLLLLMY